MAVQIGADPLVDSREQQRIIKQGGADAHRAGAGDQEFERVFGTGDAALADDGSPVLAAYLIDLVYFQQGDGFDGWPRQPPLVVPDDRGAGLDVDRHPHQGIDNGEGVRARFQTDPGAGGDVGLIGRELGDEGLGGGGPTGGYYLCRQLPIIAEGRAALLDIGTGDVDLDGVDGGIVEPAGDFVILLDRGARDVGDEPRLAEVEGRQNPLYHMVDAGVLQADGVQHAVRGFTDPVRRVSQPRFQGSSLEANSSGIPIRESLDARILRAEADTSGQQHQGRVEAQSAKVDRQPGIIHPRTPAYK